MAFKSQKEIYAHLLNGGFVICNDNYLGFKLPLIGFDEDGVICEFDEYGRPFRQSNVSFCVPSAFEPKIPLKWYDNIPRQGILCWPGTNKRHPIIIIKTDIKNGKLIFKNIEGLGWSEVTPLTKEELRSMCAEVHTFKRNIDKIKEIL
jgi:hypothetical protein